MKCNLTDYRYSFNGYELYREGVFGDELIYERLERTGDWEVIDQFTQGTPTDWFPSIEQAIFHENIRLQVRIDQIEEVLNRSRRL